MINDTFKRIQVRAQAAVQNTSTSTTNANDLLPKVKDWCRTRYDRILRAYPWSELTRNYNLSVTANIRDYSLRYDLESIIKMWDTTNGNEITAYDIRDHIRFNAIVSDVTGNSQTGNPLQYIDIGSKGCSALMSIADKVQVGSSSASDVSPVVVRIAGEVSGILMAESITLTGVTFVDSVNTYDESSELQVTTGTSSGVLQDLVGVVTIREKTTPGNVLGNIAPTERVPLYKWIRMSQTPARALTAQVWYKRKWLPLTNDNDAPIIPCANEIIEGVMADALWEDGQDGSGQEAKFANGVQELWKAIRPKNLIQQIVPDGGDPQAFGGRNLNYFGNSY